MTFAAISNRAWTKPIGWVHWPAGFAGEGFRELGRALPVSDDLNGWLGDHQTSDDRLCPASPSASTACGKRMALPIDAALGTKPCWRAWFQKVVKSGGMTTPVMISALPWP
jgi:hypothetical protein